MTVDLLSFLLYLSLGAHHGGIIGTFTLAAIACWKAFLALEQTPLFMKPRVMPSEQSCPCLVPSCLSWGDLLGLLLPLSFCWSDFGCGDAGLMTLLGFCGFQGPTAFLLALATAILLLRFPGKDPHELFRDKSETIRPGMQDWLSPGVRNTCMLAAQLKIFAMAFRCFWQISSLHAAPGQLCGSQTSFLYHFL